MRASTFRCRSSLLIACHWMDISLTPLLKGTECVSGLGCYEQRSKYSFHMFRVVSSVEMFVDKLPDIKLLSHRICELRVWMDAANLPSNGAGPPAFPPTVDGGPCRFVSARWCISNIFIWQGYLTVASIDIFLPKWSLTSLHISICWSPFHTRVIHNLSFFFWVVNHFFLSMKVFT